MVTVVAIDVPADLSPAFADAVVRSCQNAIGAGRCALSEKLEGPGATWYAIIRTSDADSAKLRIEFRSRAPTGPLLGQRTLAFAERDVPENRWASAGLVVAGLVRAEEASLAANVPRERDKTEVPHEPPPPPSRTQWGADAGGLIGPETINGQYRLGGFVRGWIAPTSSGMMGAASVRFAEREGTASLTWWSLSAGVGARFLPSRSLFNGEIVGELVFERLLVSAVDASRGLEDRGGQNRFGGRLGANSTLRLWRDLHFLVGADVSAMTPPVDIQVRGALEGREPPVRFAFTAGFRLTL